MASSTAWHIVQDIRSYPTLDRETELALALRWRDEQDTQARRQLIRSTLKLSLPIVFKYIRGGEPLGELISEASLALLHALDKFDPDRGNRFHTYASYWVRARLTEYVRSCRSVVSFPRSRFVAGTVAADVPLDAPAEGQHGMYDLLPGEGPDPESSLSSKQQRARLIEILERAGLEPRERYMVEQRFLSDHEREPSLAALGRNIGVSREWARHLSRRGLEKLERAALRG